MPPTSPGPPGSPEPSSSNEGELIQRCLAGDTAAFEPLFRPYAEGDFLWAIPLWYGVRGSQPEGVAVFTTAKQHATADGTGRATIEKKGAGPFSVDAADPTSGYHDPTG